jgi:hypothetical protein
MNRSTKRKKPSSLIFSRQIFRSASVSLKISQRDRHNDGYTRSVTGSSLDFHFSADLRGSRAHTVQSEAFIFIEGDPEDPGTIIFDLKNKVWCVPDKAHGNQSWIGMAHGVVNCFLGDA